MRMVDTDNEAENDKVIDKPGRRRKDKQRRDAM